MDSMVYGFYSFEKKNLWGVSEYAGSGALNGSIHREMSLKTVFIYVRNSTLMSMSFR